MALPAERWGLGDPDDRGSKEPLRIAATADPGGARAVSLGGPALDIRIDPKLPPDVGEFNRIRETPVRHHLSQSDYPRTREEQPGNAG